MVRKKAKAEEQKPVEKPKKPKVTHYRLVKLCPACGHILGVERRTLEPAPHWEIVEEK